MKTAFAYLVAILSTRIMEAVALSLSTPIVLLKRIDAQPLYWLEAVIVTMMGGFVSVGFTQAVFDWLSVPFSVWPVAIMFAATALHKAGRIMVVRHSSRSPMEWSYAIGGTLGLSVGAAYFVYDASRTTVLSVALIPVVLIAYGILTSRLRSFPFWKVVSELPDEAYDWFTEDPCWSIYDPANGQSVKPNLNDYNGGFPVYVPKLGRRITVYGRFDQIAESEHRFLARYRPDVLPPTAPHPDGSVKGRAVPPPPSSGATRRRPPWVTTFRIVVGLFVGAAVLLWAANHFLRVAGPGDERSQGVIEYYLSK